MTISEKIREGYFRGSLIRNEDTVAIMDFLTTPNNINKMIIASDMGLPVLTPVVKELEDKFGYCELSPLRHTEATHNAVHRQNVGRMTKYIMAQFGYVPISKGLSEKSRLPKFSGARYFSTSTVYSKLSDAKYLLNIDVIES